MATAKNTTPTTRRPGRPRTNIHKTDELRMGNLMYALVREFDDLKVTEPRRARWLIQEVADLINVLEKSVLDEIERVITFRNRIVHMNFQQKPNRHKALLNPAQAASIAAKAKECARYYTEFLDHNFSELKLPIRTIRSLWHFDDDLEDA